MLEIKDLMTEMKAGIQDWGWHSVVERFQSPAWKKKRQERKEKEGRGWEGEIEQGGRKEGKREGRRKEIPSKGSSGD